MPRELPFNSMRVPSPNTVLTKNDGADAVAHIRDWLAHFDIIAAGRFGAWRQVDAFVDGRNAALAAPRGSSDAPKRVSA